MTKFRWGHDGIGAFIRRDIRELPLSFSPHHEKKQRKGGHRKLERKVSPETDHAGNLILDFSPPQLW